MAVVLPCAGQEHNDFRFNYPTMLACSATGEKLKPLVALVKPEQLPVTNIANKKAWMTNDIFLTWIKDVNQEMKRKDATF